MPNQLAHFAIEADDVDRARAFYQSVFGWTFEPWGPPDFYLIRGAGTQGALQQRTGPAEPGVKGFECSFAVTDLEASILAVQEAGGTVLGQHEIPTVGELATFRDTEGNQAIVIQYTETVVKEMGF